MSRLSCFLRSLCTPKVPEWDPSRAILQQPDFPVAVCWSAKSGCSTILKWFLAHNGMLDEALAYSPRLRKKNILVHRYRIEQLYEQPNYASECERVLKHRRREIEIIKVIRDPALRAVSSFLHFLRNSDEGEWSVSSVVAQWKVLAGIERQQGLSFRQFLMCVTWQQLKGFPLEIHIGPQYHPQQDPSVDTVIRLEDLATELTELEDRLGLAHVDVRQLSESFHHNKATGSHAWPNRAADYPADRNTLDELGTPPPQNFLDPETRLLIRTAYWTDYEAYGHHYDAPATTLRMQQTHAGEMGEKLSGRMRPAA